MNNPVVAMVVPVRNRREKTLRFLTGISLQDYSALKVYLVDSNSSDDTVSAVRAAFPRVRLIPATDDDYWAGATNLGVEAALKEGAEYILTINDDAVVEKGFVTKLVELANRHGLPVLAARIDFMDCPGKIFALGGMHDRARGANFQLRHFGRYADEFPIEDCTKEIEGVDFAPGDGVLIRRDVYERCGLYDRRNYPHYHADSELLIRAARAGLRSHVTRQVIVYNDTSDFEEKAMRPLQRLSLGRGGRPAFFASLWLTLRKAIALATDKRSAKYFRSQLHCIWHYRDDRLALTWSYLRMLFKEAAASDQDWAFRKMRKRAGSLGKQVGKLRGVYLRRQCRQRSAVQHWTKERGS